MAIAALVWFAAIPNLPCQFPAGEECPPEDDAAKIVPGDALAYAHANVDQETDQFAEAATLANRLPTLSDQILGFLPGPSGRPLDFQQDIRPWLAGEVALSLVPGTGGRPEQALLFEVADTAGAQGFAEGLASGPLTESDHAGVAVRTDQRGNSNAIVSGFLVLGPQAAVEQTIDVAEGDERSLTSSPLSEQVLDALPEDAVAQVAVSEAGVDEVLAGSRGSLGSLEAFVDFDASVGAGAALVVEEDVLEIAVHSELDPEQLEASPGFFEAFAPFDPSLSSELGPETLAYLGLGDPAASIEDLFTQAIAEAPGVATGFDGLIDELQRSGKLDVQSELLPLLQGQAAISIQPVATRRGGRGWGRGRGRGGGARRGHRRGDAGGDAGRGAAAARGSARAARDRAGERRAVPPLRRRRRRRGRRARGAREAAGATGRRPGPRRDAAGPGLPGPRDRRRSGPEPAPVADRRPDLRDLRRPARDRHGPAGHRAGRERAATRASRIRSHSRTRRRGCPRSLRSSPSSTSPICSRSPSARASARTRVTRSSPPTRAGSRRSRSPSSRARRRSTPPSGSRSSRSPAKLPGSMGADSYLFTSESVTEGHPDKVADQISDGVLDAVLRDDPTGRVACETLVNTGLVVVSGEISTETYVDIQEIARETIRRIGYTDADLGFSADSAAVLNAIDKQSPDIAQGVDEALEARTDPADDDELDVAGAGDQGMMFGYATNETEELMPLPISLAHKLAHRLAEIRRGDVVPYLRPDGKTQVTVRYEDGKPVEIEKILISTQHKDGIDTDTLIRPDLWEHVVHPVLPGRPL